ncbi:putative Ig domain-containing protein [Leptospira sp. 201903071]|uniref:putative Ig domain-containing protein n=1 Tax=Leptospira ainazelensis TaxID=2810034 RepID=UPI001963A84C|nr:putative Ig domain-containing protein [Leptospira ainazelensis]MBM9502065.1 putative Ig domain-containing protein [Leptospira ainazelensis]
MQKRKIIVSVSSILLFLFSLTGCLTENRDGNDWIIPLGNLNLGNSSNGDPSVDLRFSYPSSSYQFVKNESIPIFKPTSVEPVDHYSISPSIPSGLSFDPMTGEISGTPTSDFPPTSFYVTAFDLQGRSSQISISLESKALDWENQSFLKGSNLLANHYLGVSVSLSGNTVVSGAYGDSAFTGAAYVFTRSGNNWTQEAYLTPPFPTNTDIYGISVSISGDTIVVGAPLEDGNQNFISTNGINDESLMASGAAYVYRRNGATWNLEAFLKPSNLDAGDNFGRFVAINGDTIAIGSPREKSTDPTLLFGTNASADNTGTNTGAVYVFKRTGTTWAQEAYLKSNNPTANDQFGSEIAISGDTLIVGVSQDDTVAVNSGAAHVFKRNGNVWSREAYLKASNPLANAIFGVSVGLSGDTAIIGASGQTGGGASYIFKRTANVWAEEAVLIAPNADASDQFGKAVAVSGDTVAIAAPNESNSITTILNRGTLPNLLDNGSLNSGAVYVFQKENNAWVYRSFIKTWNADPNDRVSNTIGGPAGEYGSLSIEGNSIVLGATEEKSGTTAPSPLPPIGDNTRTRAGAVYVFVR